MDGSARSYPRSLYVLVGLLTSALLLYTVVEQIVDANFQVLWEVTNMLAGDHPYRDFFLTGWPLETVLSLVVQWLVGYRLIGEYLVHWIFIVAGIVIGFHLALRLSRSATASLALIPVTMLSLAPAATVHFPKLFFYPLAVLVAWRYLDSPSAGSAAVAGLVTAVAFLFRHDHGVFIGMAFVCAFVLARAAVPSSRAVPAMCREAAAYAAVAALILMPWAVVVHLNEGVPEFMRTRAEWGGVWVPPSGSPFDALWVINPLRIVQGIDLTTWRLRDGEDLIWLVQLTLLLPALALLSVGLELVGGRGRGRLMTPDTCAVILLAGLSTFVMSRLGREESYYVVVLPLSIALGARLLAGRPVEPVGSETAARLVWARRGWWIVWRILAGGVLLITMIAAFGRVDRDLFSPSELDELRRTYRLLFSSPPMDAYQPAEEAQQLDWAGWQASNSDTRQKIMIRYMHDCARETDRILVTGSTPYHVGYFVERPLAGGQMQWHHRWRSDPVHETQALALIRRESVLFAFSTHDPVLADFKAYPRILAYLQDHYVEIDGSGGLLLADKRRQASGRFGRLGFPCFR